MVEGALACAPAVGHARYLEIKTFASLDGLRALSILAVLWHHTHPGIPGWPISERGFLGVDLFFEISGFLIVTLLLRERRRTGTISLKGFYVRRALRIFPPYYAMLAFMALQALLVQGSTSAALLRDLPFALLYVSNMVPMSSMLAITWSLSTEEQFYLVVPSLEKYGATSFLLALPILYVLVSLPPFWLFSGASLPSFFRETTFGPILLGVLLAHGLDDPRGHRWVARLLGHRLMPFLMLALVVLTCSTSARDISGWPRLFIHWALLGLLASCVVGERHALQPLLSVWALRRLGIVSYGIYLYHLIVSHFVGKGLEAAHVASPMALFVLTTLATWAVAELSYRLFESRFLALKARFAEPRWAIPRPAAQS